MAKQVKLVDDMTSSIEKKTKLKLLKDTMNTGLTFIECGGGDKDLILRWLAERFDLVVFEDE